MEGGRIETKRRKDGERREGWINRRKERVKDRWKERQEEDSGILISTVSKGVNILVKHFMGKETTSY